MIVNAFEVLSVDVVTIVQALRYLDFNGNLSGKTREKLVVFKEIIPEIKQDFPLSDTLEAVKNFIKENEAY